MTNKLLGDADAGAVVLQCRVADGDIAPPLILIAIKEIGRRDSLVPAFKWPMEFTPAIAGTAFVADLKASHAVAHDMDCPPRIAAGSWKRYYAHAADPPYSLSLSGAGIEALSAKALRPNMTMRLCSQLPSKAVRN